MFFARGGSAVFHNGGEFLGEGFDDFGMLKKQIVLFGDVFGQDIIKTPIIYTGVRREFLFDGVRDGVYDICSD